ncbi:hypothetical protein [Amycolatopsis sp. MtRt-6]|uniref:hypothetical protein n=1 Tax=Amycolatopsis sp. MtRt-6 TaxID=2792782 RepID=UPI001A9004C8|nr:hypothetical protein [Amycolatopsis sp. MtRt-6]
MQSFIKKFAVVAGVVAAACTAVPATQAVAAVATCPGTEIRNYGLPKLLSNSLGEQAGVLRLWYSSANGGTNCAKVYDNMSGSHPMSVSIRTERMTTPVTDSGTFSTYAGGVVVTRTDGLCIYVSGSLSLGTGSVNQFRASAGPVACG